jgi:hypothetical protein
VPGKHLAGDDGSYSIIIFDRQTEEVGEIEGKKAVRRDLNISFHEIIPLFKLKKSGRVFWWVVSLVGCLLPNGESCL